MDFSYAGLVAEVELVTALRVAAQQLAGDVNTDANQRALQDAINREGQARRLLARTPEHQQRMRAWPRLVKNRGTRRAVLCTFAGPEVA